MSYVVNVKPPDDHPAAVHVYGTFRDLHRANEFCAKILTALDSDPYDDYAGYAYVMLIRQPKVREAIEYARRGEPNLR